MYFTFFFFIYHLCIIDIYLKNVSDKAISNDELLSLLIFIILKTNPKKLITNIMLVLF